MDGFAFPAPFPGLYSFEPTQTDLFFGRDAEIRQLIEKLRSQRLVGVVGISGIGKSSLSRAGVIPRLAQGYLADQAARWRTIIVKPGNSPLVALARKLADCFGLAEGDVAAALGNSSRGLVKLAAEHLGSDEGLFILVDQFEELMRFSTDETSQREAAAEFVDLLLSATGHGPLERADQEKSRIFVVLTMRSEFLGKCTRFPGLAEALNDGQLLVPRLERNHLKLAVEGPVAMVGGRISPALVQRLLNDAANEIDQLPLIQFALARMWEVSAPDRAEGKELGLEHYEAVGGSIVTALNRAADAAIDALKRRDSRNESIIRRMFQRLAEPGAAEEEVRRPSPLSELAAVAECPVAEMRSLVDDLARHGFLTVSGDDDPEIDITHESLIRRWETLNAWVREEAVSADIYRRLVGASTRQAAAYRGRDLNEALRWRVQYRPTGVWAARYSLSDKSFDGAMAFLERSRRRRWLFAGLSLTAASVTLVAAGVFWYAQRETKQHLRTVVVNRLFFQAQGLANGPSNLAQKSLLLALEALKIQPSAQLDRFVREQSAIMPVLKASMQHAGTVSALAFTLDGKFLISASEDKTLRVWDLANGTQLSSVPQVYQVRELRYDPASGHIATLAFDMPELALGQRRQLPSQVTVWRLQGSSLIGPIHQQNYADRPPAIALADGKLWLADGSSLSSLRLDSIASGAQSMALKGKQLVFTSDGKFLLSVDGNAATARNLATGVTTSLEVPEARGSVRVIISQDGQYVGLVDVPGGAASQKLHAWRLEPLAKIANGAPHDAWGGVISSEGKFVAVARGLVIPEGSVTETATGKVVGAMEDKETGRSGRMWEIARFSHDNTRVALATGGSAVRIYSLAPWKELFRIGLGEMATQAVWGADDRTIAVATESGLITVWSFVSDEDAHRISAPDFAYSPSGLFSVSASDSSYRVLGTSGGEMLQRFDGDDSSHVFSGDERRFAWIDHKARRVAVYALPQARLLCTFDYSGDALKVAFRRSDAIMMMTRDGYLSSWNADSCQGPKRSLLGVFEKNQFDSEADQWQVYFSPQGAVAAVDFGGKTDSMTLWDVDSGKPTGVIPAESFSGLSFSPDEKLVSGHSKQGVAVWRASSAEELWHQKVGDLDWQPTFDSTGRRLAGSAGHVARVWDSMNGKTLLEDNDEAEVVRGVAFDRSGDFLASAWSGGRVKIWEIGAGVQISDIPVRVSWGSNPFFAFNADGSRLVVEDAALQNTLRSFSWRRSDVIREGCRHVAFNLSSEDWKRLGGYYTPSEPTCPSVPVRQ